jgi:hypothetical protein
MNYGFALKTKKIFFFAVDYLIRASLRYGGAGSFFKISVTDPPPGCPVGGIGGHRNFRIVLPKSFHKNIQYYEQAGPPLRGSFGRLVGASLGRNVVWTR